MKNIDIYWRRYNKQATRYKIREILYIGHWCLSPLQSRHLGTWHRSPNHHQLLCCIFLNLTHSLKSSPSKVILVLGKARCYRAPNMDYGGGHVGDLMFCQKLCMRQDAWVGVLLWWSCQSPGTHNCGLLSHPNSFRGGRFKLNAKFDADSFLYLLSHFECDGYTAHLLTQQHLPPRLTGTVKSSLFTHVHSSSLSLAAR